MATWLAHRLPRAPPAKRSSTLTLSSMTRPGTSALTSAATSATFSPRHEFSELEGMRADVAQRTGAGLLGIRAPARLLLPGLLERGCQPALRILHLYYTQFPDETVRDQLLGVPDHRVAGVVESDA